MITRDYQIEDIDSIFHQWKTHNSTLCVEATGLGKTVIMANVVKRMLPQRAIMLAHRSELISQARNMFYLNGIDCEIEKADMVASSSLFNRQPVVLATVQTMLSGKVDRKRMHRFNPKEFGLLLYDESHHSVSTGNKSIVDYFMKGNPNIKVLGVTATPTRADSKALGQIFQSVAANRDILWGIDNGWLVDLEQVFVSVSGLDYSGIKTTAGDLNGAELARVLEAEHNIHEMVQPTLEAVFGLKQKELSGVDTSSWASYLSSYRPVKHTIVFTASVKQAEMMSNIFNRVVPGLSSWVEGRTPESERMVIMGDFKSGRTSILVNCGITTEGFDDPMVDLVVMAKPTKSETLFRQMVGRATRTLPGLVDGLTDALARRLAISSSKKPRATIMDFVGNSGRHKLISCIDILGGNYSDEAIKKATEKAKVEGRSVNIQQDLLEAEEEIRRRIEQARLLEESRRAKIVLKSEYTTSAINPFDALDIRPVMDPPMSDGRVLSHGQRKILLQAGLDPNQYKYSEGSQLARTILMRWKNKMSSIGQCRILKRAGYEHPEQMKSVDARNLIEKVKENGWRKI